MNKDNAKDFMPLVQALADGKTIQARRINAELWDDLSGDIRFDHCDGPGGYRIKPESREWTLVRMASGHIYDKNYYAGSMPPQEIIRVREIID